MTETGKSSDGQLWPILKTLDPVVSLQEVPGEISLIFQITGCPHQCAGCHSAELWSNLGAELTFPKFKSELQRYEGLLTCVCFFGGEWAQDSLFCFLKYAQQCGYKTCLYSGAVTISPDFYKYLNYLKLGPWIQALGGLDSKNTNQIFYDLDKKITLNHLFQKNL